MRKRSSRGYTLIETLVAMVVLGVGLVGVLGLKLVGFKHSVNSNARAAAAIHAGDILDRLRANPTRAMAGEYNLAIGAATPTSATTIAQQDLVQWRQALATNFSDGSGGVAVTAGGAATIELRWTERDDSATGGRTMTFSFRSNL